MEQVPLTGMLGDEQLELVMLSAFESSDAYDLEADRRFATLMCPAEGGWHGGTGTVREAYTTAFEHVALKTMAIPNALLFREDEYEHELSMRIAAFREEYETLLKLRVMRAFPTVYGYGMLEDAPAIVMEWIEGTSLAELNGKLSTEEVTKLARAVFLLLEQVENQVTVFVHRDLAPSNIIVRTKNRPLEEQLESGNFDLCLVDLGSTTVAREVGKSFTTRMGALRGATPAYAAPEMLSLESDVELRNSSKVDAYAVSSVMWELLTGAQPYGENSVDGLLRAKREAAPDSETLDLDEDATRLARILAKGMDPNQETRPASQDMRIWLDDLLAGKPGFWDGSQPQPLILRRRMLIGAGIAAAAGGIALVVSHFMGPVQQEPEVTEPEDLPSGLSPDAPMANLDDYRGALLPCVSTEGTWGFVTTATEWAVHPIYRSVGYFSGGYAIVQSAESGLFGFIDSKGNMPIDLRFKAAQPFGQASLAAVQDADTGLWGYIDRTGTWSLDPVFANAGEFTEMAPVQDAATGLWGYINRSGVWMIMPAYASEYEGIPGAGAVRNGLAPVCLSDGSMSYIRYDGSIIDNVSFTEAGEFFEGYARVSKEGMKVDSYLVDSSFGAIGSSDYVDVGRVSQGMFAARHMRGAWGFGEVSSWRITVLPVFRGVGRFVQGAALACDFETRHWGYVDMNGNWIVRPIMADVLPGLIAGGGFSE